MEILKGVEDAELRLQIQMESSMTHARQIDQNDIAVALLQGERGVDRCGRASRATLGAEQCEYPGFTGTS